jgi:hypothetical protein
VGISILQPVTLGGNIHDTYGIEGMVRHIHSGYDSGNGRKLKTHCTFR